MYYKETMFVKWRGTKRLRKLKHHKLFPCAIKYTVFLQNLLFIPSQISFIIKKYIGIIQLKEVGAIKIKIMAQDIFITLVEKTPKGHVF